MRAHYVVRRARSGRFNFTLLSEHGRISGSVTVPIEKRTRTEIEVDAHRRIALLAAELARATRADRSGVEP